MAQSPELKFGELFSTTATYLALDWHARKVVPGDRGEIAIDGILAGIDGKGVYCFEGRHDAHPSRTVLYIGQSQREKPLRKRIEESFSRFQAGGRLYSNVDELVVRWATLPQATHASIDDVESLLIVAHAPPFNAQEVCAWYEGSPDLVLLNAGSKGRLMPALAGRYFMAGGWPAR